MFYVNTNEKVLQRVAFVSCLLFGVDPVDRCDSGEFIRLLRGCRAAYDAGHMTAEQANPSPAVLTQDVLTSCL